MTTVSRVPGAAARLIAPTADAAVVVVPTVLLAVTQTWTIPAGRVGTVTVSVLGLALTWAPAGLAVTLLGGALWAVIALLLAPARFGGRTVGSVLADRLVARAIGDVVDGPVETSPHSPVPASGTSCWPADDRTRLVPRTAHTSLIEPPDGSATGPSTRRRALSAPPPVPASYRRRAAAAWRAAADRTHGQPARPTPITVLAAPDLDEPDLPISLTAGPASDRCTTASLAHTPDVASAAGPTTTASCRVDRATVAPSADRPQAAARSLSTTPAVNTVPPGDRRASADRPVREPQWDEDLRCWVVFDGSTGLVFRHDETTGRWVPVDPPALARMAS